jgi:hypothetical protein
MPFHINYLDLSYRYGAPSIGHPDSVVVPQANTEGYLAGFGSVGTQILLAGSIFLVKYSIVIESFLQRNRIASYPYITYSPRIM